MKIAIASEGKDLNSEISSLGAKAPYYLIFEDKKLTETIKNPFAVGSGGAGFSVAYLLEGKGVKVFIAKTIGENMKGALDEKGIKFVEENMAQSALDAIKILSLS
jgi:predicted Fe-Mo cluster-binding NifX family protein